MARKGMSLFFAAALLVTLTACAAPGTPETEDAPLVGVCFRQDGEADGYRALLEQALTDAGFAPRVVDAGCDQTKQNRQIRDLLAAGCALLIIEPVMVCETEETVRLIRQADVPAVLIRREPEREVLEGWDKVCYVGSDAAQPGTLQGKILLAQPNQGDLNGDGVLSYVILQGPQEDLDVQLRTAACIRALADARIEGIMLGCESGERTRQSGRQMCARALAIFGTDIEAVFCSSDVLALGALEALENAQRRVGKDVYLIGVDGEAEVLTRMAQGAMTGTVIPDLPGQAAQTVVAVQRLLAGEATEKICYVNYIGVTGQNARQILPG